MAKLTKKEFIESLKEMNIKEVMELIEGLKEEFGIDPTAVAAVAATPAAAAAEEKSTFNVTLKPLPATANKVGVIKVVKDLLGLGLKDAKDLVDGAPKILKEDVAKDAAEDMKAKLTEAGATVELQ